MKHTTPKKTELQQARKLLGWQFGKAEFQQTLPYRTCLIYPDWETLANLEFGHEGLESIA
ncbi:hypothetical protein NRI58_004832 [Vibrio parahaemolyticus]|nr:hypothetical protein [Vibrio parahaemolyticus]ELB2264767.1 hypothetical protein [Vibrio parahaemolyticus]